MTLDALLKPLQNPVSGDFSETAGIRQQHQYRNQTPRSLRAPAVLAERATPLTTDRLAPVLMTRVGIAASPAFCVGFLICAEKGFMVLSYL